MFSWLENQIMYNKTWNKMLFAGAKDIYKKVLELTPYLLDCTEKIRAYCKNRNYILEK